MANVFYTPGLKVSQFERIFVLRDTAPQDVSNGDVVVMFDARGSALQYDGKEILLVYSVGENPDGFIFEVLPFNKLHVAQNAPLPPYVDPYPVEKDVKSFIGELVLESENVYRFTSLERVASIEEKKPSLSSLRVSNEALSFQMRYTDMRLDVPEGEVQTITFSLDVDEDTARLLISSCNLGVLYLDVRMVPENG